MTRRVVIVESLSGVTAGRWTVTTMSGAIYDVDLDHATLARRPPPGVAAALRLRRDGDRLRLRAVVMVTVGSPALFVVDLDQATGALTTRRTSTVVSIVPAKSNSSAARLDSAFKRIIGDWDPPDRTENT